jgi:N-acetylmuramic acid 6-phosphate etherase
MTRTMAPRFLGIETGATHTTVLLADEHGKALKNFQLGPANLRLISSEEFSQLLRSIRRRLGHRVSAIGLGMAGLRTRADHARVIRTVHGIWPGVPVHASHDLESAMMALGPLSKDIVARVLLLSGTGSNAFGKRRDGKTANFGGRGHILGDQGSACDIALTALRGIAYEHDLRREFPRLGRAFLRATQLNQPDDLIAWTQEAEKHEIARLAVTVFDEGRRGDKLARSILHDAAERLVDMAVNCAAVLAKRNERVEFVLTGGVLLHQADFAAEVARRLRRAWPDSIVHKQDRPGAWGAVEMAMAVRNTHPEMTQLGGGRGPIEEEDTGPVPVAVLAQSPTEKRNPRSMRLDKLPLKKAIKLMLSEDALLPGKILKAQREIEWLLQRVIRAFRSGGRLFYVGAGTSGRLGILDASECPPTFRAPTWQVQGIIAGGRRAIWSAVEGAEDDLAGGVEATAARGIRKGDVVLGISASGRAPFVWGALQEAKRLGAVTALLCFNPSLKVKRADAPHKTIIVDSGPEILTGSTRLKAGTATKLVLNILTTLGMVHSGKVISNLMVNLHPVNAKLRDRAARLVMELTGTDRETAAATLEAKDWEVSKAYAALERSGRTNHRDR